MSAPNDQTQKYARSDNYDSLGVDESDDLIQGIDTPPSSPEKNSSQSECHETNVQECRPTHEKVELPRKPQQMQRTKNVRHETLVTRQALNGLWRSNRTNETLVECEKICTFLMKKSKYIIHVYPAYDSENQGNVVFVVLTDKNIRRPKCINYALVIRNVNACSGKSKDTMRKAKYRRNKNRLSQKQAREIREVIDKNAKELMQNHRYLSVITGSGFRSTNYGEKVPRKKREPCIALYVCVKGKIPLTENELPKKINGISVDVREGFFQTSVLTADKFHKKLPLGCQITSEENADSHGTLGGFVDHTEYGLCGITCAHVVLNKGQLHDHRGHKRKIWEDGHQDIYQPANIRPKNRVGSLKETVYSAGRNGEAGVDLAVFKIESRHPDSGQFPQNTEMCYDTGRVVRESQLNVYNGKVLKYGQTTGRTEGFLEFIGTAVKRIDFNLKYNVASTDFTYTLFDQYEIRPHFGHDLFSDAGDSGALVLTETADRKLAGVGMIVGNLNFNRPDGTVCRGNSIVIPVSAIMKSLGISELKSFVWNRIDSMEKSMSSIDKRLEKLDEMETRMKNIEEMLQASTSKQ